MGLLFVSSQSRPPNFFNSPSARTRGPFLVLQPIAATNGPSPPPLAPAIGASPHPTFESASGAADPE
eukprot:scaffold1509_cov240-Pinguiococcus_pyrenoidosus.AAC.31